MTKQHCESCVHFHQHYIIRDGKLIAVNRGHCAHPRIKSRAPMTKACAHFTRLRLLVSSDRFRHYKLEVVKWP